MGAVTQNIQAEMAEQEQHRMVAAVARAAPWVRVPMEVVQARLDRVAVVALAVAAQA